MSQRQTLLSPELAQRLAAIDIGTNSIRLIIAEPLTDGGYRVLDDERESTRLGKNLSATGHLDPDAVDRSMATLKRMKLIAEGYQVRQMRVIATSAVREADDGEAFCQRAKEELDLEIEVITAETEARLAFLGITRSFDLTGKNVAVADIGGGSTELVLASGNFIEAIQATQLGAVRMTERYGGDGAWSAEAYKQLQEAIDQELQRGLKHVPFPPYLLIGSGGTFTTLASILMASKGQDGLPVRGYQVTRAEVSHLVARLRKMNSKMRRSVPGLGPDRADIIVAGLAIIDRIMRHFRLNLLQVHSGGVRDGLLLSLVDESRGGSKDDPHDRQAVIERFAAACGVEVKHAKHVAKLACSILQQLSHIFDVSEADTPLLDAAAQLQDVGYLINYDRHHKHSYHLILNSNLSGFRPHELEMVANLARYHRGARPKKKHANFNQLNASDRRRVEQLASILRVAGGLDRSHSQLVDAVEIVPRKRHIELLVHCDQYPEVDIWGARRRAPLFERVFGVTLGVRWAGPAPQHPESTTADSSLDAVDHSA
ncbi:unnamed protein product [Cladocopium goreaui]|uniref:Exopolyphosphatase (ExopolyPase) n=1 Tax=Cladocopium goreaui TaxID=2562237 RepID=A0A9P1BFM8_9DINO|nr:unnamed protein product [Cladocopium goreaui]CAI3972078.1 unnamed protein product [Cladocopium goreaui]